MQRIERRITTKKIPTLFERIYENHRVVGITEKVASGMEWVLDGDGVATIKIDGSCCAIIDGEFYKRYDAKKVKKPPEGAIPCCEPDPTTSHWPHWVKCERNDPADKWFWVAYDMTPLAREDGTYEAIGPHFQGNPYELPHDMIMPHGMDHIEVERTFSGIRDFLEHSNMEGIVFWKDNQPMCKIKRSDFGFDWPVKK